MPRGRPLDPETAIAVKLNAVAGRLASDMTPPREAAAELREIAGRQSRPNTFTRPSRVPSDMLSVVVLTGTSADECQPETPSVSKWCSVHHAGHAPLTTLVAALMPTPS